MERSQCVDACAFRAAGTVARIGRRLRSIDNIHLEMVKSLPVAKGEVGMKMSESLPLLRALAQISRGLDRAEMIVDELVSKDKRGGKRPKRSNRLLLMKKR